MERRCHCRTRIVLASGLALAIVAPPAGAAADTTLGFDESGSAGQSLIPVRSPFHVVPVKGRQYVTSYDHGGAGDEGIGAIYQDFRASARTCFIDFRVHGGHATGTGFQQGNVERLRLAIVDTTADRWGFISATDFKVISPLTLGKRKRAPSCG